MQSKFRIAAYGVVWDNDGRILLTHGADEHVGWFLPGGGVKHGEHPRDTVIREFAASSGLNIDVERPRDALSAVSAREIHSNAVIFDVRINSGRIAGTGLEWVEPQALVGRQMTPFVAAALGWRLPRSLAPSQKVAYGPRPTPPRQAKRGRRRRGQRFGAYGLTTDDQDHVLLARISDGYPGAGCWHLPGGGVDFGEQPRDALLREIGEETGQHAEVQDLMDVTSFRHRRAIGPEGYPLDWHGVRAIYRARVPEPSRARVIELAGGSTSESRWWPLAEVPDLKLSPAVEDALRIAKDLA